MSYKSSTPDSFTRSSRKEIAKYIIPFSIGFIVALFIWMGWLSPQISDESETNVGFVMSGLFVIILLVEIPIAAIVIYLTYRNRVLKMKAQSTYKMGNVNEYLQAYEQFQEGKYEFETIKSGEDIEKAYENGKKIVFTRRKSGEKAFIWIGILFILIGLIISIVFFTLEIGIEFKLIVISIVMSILGIIGIISFFPSYIKLKRLHRSFFVLGHEGIVYRRIWGGIRSYSWKELDLKIYTVKTTMSTMVVLKTEFPPTVEIHIILPNKAIIIFDPEKFHLSEIISFDKLIAVMKNSDLTRSAKYMIAQKNKSLTLYLVAKAFEHYFDSGKNRLNNSDKKEKESKFTSDNPSQKFPPISELFKKSSNHDL